jgi:hypothetical protein
VVQIADFDRVAPQHDLSPIRPVSAGYNLDQGAFARSVFPEEGVHLTLHQGEIDPIKRRDRAEAFGNVAHLECDRQRRGICRLLRSGRLPGVTHTSCQGRAAVR